MFSVWSADRRAVRCLADGLCGVSVSVLDHSAFCSSELAHLASLVDRPASSDVERELTNAVNAVRGAATQLPAAATLAHHRLDGCIAVSQLACSLPALCCARCRSDARCVSAVHCCSLTVGVSIECTRLQRRTCSQSEQQHGKHTDTHDRIIALTAALDAAPAYRTPHTAYRMTHSLPGRLAVQSGQRARLLASEQRLRALRHQLNVELSQQWSEQADWHAMQINATLARFGQPIRPHTRTASQQPQPQHDSDARTTEHEHEDVQLSDDEVEGEEKGVDEARTARGHRPQQQWTEGAHEVASVSVVEDELAIQR